MENTDIKEFRDLAFEVVARLGLPLVRDENEVEFASDVAQLYIAVAFPNLNELELGVILGGHLAARGATMGVNTATAGLNSTERNDLEETIRTSEHVHLPDVMTMIEQTGLRAKLSEFQEKLLDDLLRVHFKAES